MATHIGIGFSQLSDPALACKEAAIQAKSQLNLPIANVVVIFYTDGYATPEGLTHLRRILQPERVIGSVTPAVILSERIESKGIGILAIVSDDIKFGVAAIEQLRLNPLRESGVKLARAAETDGKMPKRQAFFCFFNGSQNNNTLFFQGLREGLGRMFAVAGAMGITTGSQAHSSQLYNDKILPDSAVGLLIGGQASFSLSARHGWQPLGKPRIIDEAENNVIRLIDKKPAITFYEDYFKDSLPRMDDSRPNLGDIGLLYPMGISTNPGEPYLLRHPVQVLSDGSIVCQAEVRTGDRVHLMIGKKDALRQAAYDAAADIREQFLSRPPKILFIFESIARRKVLGRSAANEIHLIKDVLGLTTPVFGMYTYGEIAPIGSLKEVERTQVQNASIVLAAIG